MLVRRGARVQVIYMEGVLDETVERSRDGSVVAGATAQPSAKQPYRRPKIQEYGDLKEVTLSVALTGNADGLLGGLNVILRTSILL
ncbi:MAG: hypothetical protein C3F11_04985 [Methylocystaceae bacterium]|nr:MAG: hypothetical protein C3F11_04985 [Methylocystaceae bacterium]